MQAAVAGGVDPIQEMLRDPAFKRITENPDAVTAELCKRSLWFFVQEFWDVVIPQEPMWNWHIPILCDEAQKVIERVVRGETKAYDLIINIPPGTTKSTIFVQMIIAWAWTVAPWLQFICASYSAELSLDHADRTKDIITSEKYKRLFPEIRIRRDREAKHNFLNNHRGRRFATSIGGTVTGMHAHILLVDDPLSPRKAASEKEIITANKFLDETLSTRKVDKAVTPTILIMQRLHQNDPTGHLLKKAELDGSSEIRHICLPGRISDKLKPVDWAKYYKNGLLDPVRLSEVVLKQMEADLGQYGFNAQVMQHPVPPGGGMFKIKKFQIVDGIPGKIVQVVRYWDKAATIDAGAYTVGSKMARLEDGRFIILGIVRGQWASNRREQIIKSTAEADGVDVSVYVEQEPGSGGKESAENTILQLAGFRVYADRVTGDKITRADTYSVQVNAGNVLLLRGEWNEEFIEEHEYFPMGTRKDQVDSTAGAFVKLTGRRKQIGVF